MSKWSKMSGRCQVEIYVQDGAWYLKRDNKVIPVPTNLVTRFPLDSEIAYLSFAVTASGYADPGRCSGPVELCYPPESECKIDTIEELIVEFKAGESEPGGFDLNDKGSDEDVELMKELGNFFEDELLESDWEDISPEPDYEE